MNARIVDMLYKVGVYLNCQAVLTWGCMNLNCVNRMYIYKYQQHLNVDNIIVA